MVIHTIYFVDRLYTSESDVYRRQILTYKDGPRTGRAKLFPLHTIWDDQVPIIGTLDYSVHIFSHLSPLSNHNNNNKVNQISPGITSLWVYAQL